MQVYRRIFAHRNIDLVVTQSVVLGRGGAWPLAGNRCVNSIFDRLLDQLRLPGVAENMGGVVRMSMTDIRTMADASDGTFGGPEERHSRR